MGEQVSDGAVAGRILWNYICVNKNERNFIQTNVTFPETIKNMPLQKKKNTMKTKKNYSVAQI